MSELEKYDLSGKQVGKHSVDKTLETIKANPQMIKNYLVAIRNNARQWSANTKTRAEVSRSKKKPHAQKGTGRARQGATSTPHYRGGGVAFGPKPKFDQHVRINKKERRAAIQYLLLEKIQQKLVRVLEVPVMKTPKTKKIAEFLHQTGLMNKSVLFLGESPKGSKEKVPSKKNEVFVKSMRNIPRKDFSSISHLNGYDLAANQVVVVLDTAFESFKALISGREKS